MRLVQPRGDGLSVLAAARAVPQQPALCVDGQVLTFSALVPRVRRRMRWLVDELPAQLPWPRVALGIDSRLETALWLYALLELDVTAVLLHPRLVASERATLLADCQPALVLDESFSQKFSAADAENSAANNEPDDSTALRTTPPKSADDDESDWAALPTASAKSAAACGPLAILYTSGTTGRPKGAMLSRRAFLAAAAASAENLGWQADDRWLLCMPLAHVGGLSILIRCLVARRPAVLMQSGFEPAAVAAALLRDRVTLLSVVPTMLRRLLELDPPWVPPPLLRAVLLGGAAAAEELLQRAAARRVPVLTTYGLTEACSQVTTQRYGTLPAAAQGAGAPIAGLTLRIRPADDQIELRSPTLFDGYWPPGAQALALTGDGFFATGDLGRLDAQGRLHVLARRTDLIVSGGENVYPSEVEQALERCPGVAAACVFGVADAEWGQLVAAALVATAEPLPLAELRQNLSERLAAYKHPRRLVWLPALPMNATGKIDRAAVARLALRVSG